MVRDGDMLTCSLQYPTSISELLESYAVSIWPYGKFSSLVIESGSESIAHRSFIICAKIISLFVSVFSFHYLSSVFFLQNIFHVMLKLYEEKFIHLTWKKNYLKDA